MKSKKKRIISVYTGDFKLVPDFLDVADKKKVLGGNGAI